MRHALPIALVTFAVAASAGMTSRPALAASADAAQDQPIMLAQASNNGGPNLFSLFQDVQRLQSEVRDLQGQVDTLKYQLRQNEQGQRDLYENLDKRMSALENGGAGAGSGDAAGDAQADYGTVSQDPEVEKSYTAAFDKLKSGDYDAAIGAFKGFIQQNPESSYSDNAWYWLGEANYVKRNYDASLEAFQTVVNRFRASDKVPGSLYKIGVIQDERGETDNAYGTLKRVVDQYPDSNVAEMARKRLQGLDG
ncbi:TPR domain lipoprotein [Salinisphaera shabanensis E1L3A]|uniref:Cell division coordinator CpoB n=1 Tax=Salinisphaera shabanensis E1L3A TaxID=1033802 RepID=U2E3P7_9GAMM|nr:tol-pal system protein YbgF [Salinisphaera shabanensis]ERJ18491.1 TPR domain lipoprotein [Salinisphaera shabanensis E1L3A]